MNPDNAIEKVERFLRFVKDNLQVMRLFFVQTRNSTFIEKLSGQVEKDARCRSDREGRNPAQGSPLQA